MKRIIIKFFILLLVVTVLDITFGFIADKVFFKQDRKITYGFTEVDAEIVILGSSRAQKGYISSIIEDSLNVSCFNLGLDCMCIYYYYAMIKAILEHHKPKLIVIDLIEKDYQVHNEGRPEDLNKMMKPYYGKIDALTSVYDEFVPFRDRFMLYSSLYRYNNLIFDIIKCGIKSNDIFATKGYFAHHGVMLENNLHSNCFSDLNVADHKLELFSRIFDLCKNNNVKVVCIISPMYMELENKDDLFATLTTYIKNEGIEVYNYANDSTILSTHTNFIDFLHLNNNGAIKFTNIFIEEVLKPNLPN